MTTTYQYEGNPLQITDTRNEGESLEAFRDRHFEHVRQIMKLYPPSP